MRNKFYLATVFLVAIFLASCTQNYVALDYTNAKGEVPQLGNLIFRFNKLLVADSLSNIWDSTEYISFEPQIEGRFRWDGPDQLIFSPLKPLLPATTYKAKIKSDALRYSKYDKVKDGDKITFHTAPLQLVNAQVTWVLQEEGSRKAVPQVNLQFNYPVSAAAVKDKLNIEIDGTKASVTLHTLSDGKRVSFRINDFSAADKNYEAKIKIDKGLIPVGGNNQIEEPISTLLSVPSPYVLTINSVEAEHDGTEGIIHLYTSQQVTGDNINSFIKFDPAVTFTAEPAEDGLTLRSDAFNKDKGYSFTIAQGLRGAVGGTLREEYRGNAAFGDLEAGIRFTNSKAIYLSKSGGGNIEVLITNVPKVKLIISKIYENNLLAAERSGYAPPYEEEKEFAPEEGGEDDGYNNANSAVAGDVIYTKEIDTRTLPKSGNGRLLNISQFEDRLPNLKGIYHVALRSTKDYWVEDARFISVSDIGLIAKQGADKMFVFANSIKTAEAIDGLTINVYGANNQLLGTGASNKEGVAEIALVKKEFSGFKPAMIIAKTADDFTYLPFNTTKVTTSRFDVGGKRWNPTGLDAFVYAERDMYRPGEKVNFSIIIRDRNWKSPGEIPIVLKFLLPNGKEWKSFRKGLNEQGSVEGSIDIPPSAITGSYSLEVYSSNEILLASKNFNIEEFVPDRLRVTAKVNKPFLHPGEGAQLSVNAVNFFGPPAAGRSFETEIQVKQKQFAASKFQGYDFSLANQQTFFDKEVKEGKTDGEGNAIIDYTVPALYANIGLLQAAFYTTVFDETGRPVSRYATADIYTQDVFHGIKDDGFYYYALNQPVRFSTVSLTRDGSAVAASAIVKVIKHEYRTVLSKSGSVFRYEAQKEDKVMEEKKVTISNGTVYTYIPRSPGDYEIRIYRPGANAYVGKKFYSYGGWGDNNSFEVNTEGQIDIELDKEGYTSGETAKVLFKTPFSGRMLVCTEADGVVTYQYVSVEKRTATIDLKLSSNQVPNVYVTATLFKPHEVTDIPLTVAHGFQNIKVEDKSRNLRVEITSPQKIRSRTHQTITVKAAAGSYVTLAAVDNGVLQVSNFKTPDPYQFYYQKKALGTTSYDLYPLLFPELRARLSSTGGDADLQMEKRVNPMPAKRIKILSYWSGIKKTNGSGVAQFDLEIPPFSGEVRLMAVAYKDEKFGSADATITVADPVVISTALPRFLSPGDTVQVPVTITNTTAKATNGQAAIVAGGPIKIIGNNTQNISVGANSDSRILFKIVAGPTIAVSKISINVSALSETFSNETEIAVRPASTLQKMSGSGAIAGGTTIRIAPPSHDFLPGSFKYKLVVSNSPVAQIAGLLQYLIQYPYGCTEQIVSAAFPQLYYGDFADRLGVETAGAPSATSNVLEAIRKIKMRQLYNGAVTLWDGEGTEDWWTTVYTAHFLLEAKRAGYDVDASLLETMLGYLANRLKTKQTINYYYNRNLQKKIAPKEVSYSLYVLAIANRAQVSAMNYYKAAPQLLALDSRYLLSAAYAVAGDRKSFTLFLPRSFSGEASVQQTGGSLYSEVRDEAIALNALLDVDPGNAQVPVMAKHLQDRVKTERYLNTQERAFTFLALGKLARAAAASTVTAELQSGGKTIGKINGNDWMGGNEIFASGPLEVVTKGVGRLYYSWQAEGISSSGAYKEEDNFIKVRRRYFDRFGKEILGNVFKQNDLIIVGVTLEKAFDNAIENIVITDLLPAGFEIENPRTKELPGMEWIKGAAVPKAMDVRDDRIHFFVDATTAKQSYYYAVRAVSLGKFKQGPVSADAMYNGEYHSYHGAGAITVNPVTK